MKTVLIIDDNVDYREAFRGILEDHGLEVIDSDCPESAYSLLVSMEPPDLIVCDLYMPFSMGVERDKYITSYEVGLKTLRELAWVYPNTPVVGLTALEKSDLARLKKYVAPIPAFQKPSRARDLRDLVDGFLSSEGWGGVQ